MRLVIHDAQRLVERRAEKTADDATALAARPLELKLGGRPEVERMWSC